MSFFGPPDLKATVRYGSVKLMFANLRNVDMKKTFSDLRGPARFDQRHHWRKEESPDGHWKGLAASTRARRQFRRGRGKNGKRQNWSRKLMGRFPNALQSIVTAQKLVIRSRVRKFSMVHQKGGRIGRGARLPSRQFLWISNWLVEHASKAFERALVKAAAAGH